MPYDKPSEKKVELEDEFIMPPAVLFDEKVDEAYETFINTCGCDKGKSEFYKPILESLENDEFNGVKADSDGNRTCPECGEKGFGPFSFKYHMKTKHDELARDEAPEVEDTARYTDPISHIDYSSGSELEAALDREKQAISTNGKESKDLHTIISTLSDMSDYYAQEGPVSSIHDYMKPEGRKNVMIKSGIDEQTAHDLRHNTWSELPHKIQMHLLSSAKTYDQTPVTDRKSQMPTESIANEISDDLYNKTWDHVNKNHKGHWDGWFGMEKDFFDEAGVKEGDHPKVAMHKVDNHIENLYKKKDPRVYDPSYESYSAEDLADKNDLHGDKSDKDDQDGDQGEKDVKEVDEYNFVEYGKIKVSCEACNNYTTLPDQESAISYAKEHQMKLGYAHVCTFE